MKKYDWIVDAYFLDGRWHGASSFLYHTFSRAPENLDILYCVSRSVLIDNGDQGNLISKKNTYVYKLPRILRLLELQILGVRYSAKLYCTYFTPLYSRGGICVTIHDCLFMDDKENFGFLYRAARWLFFKIAVSRSRIIHTISRYSENRIRAWFGDRGIGIVTPCGVDLSDGGYEAKVESTVSHRPIRVLYISRLESRKNHKMLCESLASFPDGVFELDCVVGNDSRDHSRFMRELKDIFPMVRFHQNVTQQQLKTLVVTADLAVYPSAGEGFGIPVVETLAAGLPTLVNNNTALSELKIPTRFLISMRSVDDLSRALSKYLSGGIAPPTHEEIFGITSEYSWDSCAYRFFSEVFKYEYTD